MAKTDAVSDVTHAPKSMCPEWFNVERTRLLTPNAIEPAKKVGLGDYILYWMQREVRTVDNWALLFATYQAQKLQVPLRVVYALPPPPDASNEDNDKEDMPPLVADMPMTERHGTFLINGLKIVEKELASKDVPFTVLYPKDRSSVGQCVYEYATSASSRALAVICDFSPLRLPRTYIEDQAAPLFDANGIAMYSIDAHNVVPVWHASPKREVGARTLRPKINKLLPEFLTHFADFEGNDHLSSKKALPELSAVDWSLVVQYLQMDSSVKPCDWAIAGHDAAMKRFTEFCQSKSGNGLKNFDAARNDLNHDDVCSNLSPWINYGHVSFQRLALEVRAIKKYSTGTAAYIEEGIVRRELSDNYVYYARNEYDSLDAAAGWARESLDLHEADEREYVYTLEEFDKAQTHDDLWNAAQLQLTRTGGMHGFLRMYWAKKILEWTPNAATALRTGLYFNDRYALDGNDPNGFVGVAWSVMGVHDMGWKERPIFGKIRFMNYNGCKRKFKVPSFVAKFKGAASNADAAIKKHAEKKKGTKRKAPA